MGVDPTEGNLFRFGAFELDEKNCELRHSGVLVDVPHQAFKVLTTLVRRSQELVTREELRNILWPEESSGDFDTRLNFEIRKIREVLRDDADSPRYLATVRKRGYKFIAPVQVTEARNSDLEFGSVGRNRSSSSVIESQAGTGVLSSTGGPARQGDQMAEARPKMGLVLSVCLLLAVLVLIAVVIRARRSQDDNISRMAFSGSDLVAWNAQGRILWTLNLRKPLNSAPDRVTERLQSINSRQQTQRDVLAMAPVFVDGQPNPSSDALYRISPTGKLLWTQVFQDNLRFGGEDYGPPWVFGGVMVTDDGPQPSIWCAVRNFFWSPSLLVKLDGDGNRLGQFANWGHMGVLNNLRTASGSYILVGGISNQCNCGMLAVLREDQPSGSSPALPGSDLSCENCPPGQPYRYLLFPRSELNSLSGFSYNNTRMIQTEDGHVNVGVQETGGGEAGLGPDWEMYKLSESFVPQSYVVSDHYLELHRQMEREGKIHHTVKRCRELTRPRTVRVWSPESGWKDVQVRRAVGAD